MRRTTLSNGLTLLHQETKDDTFAAALLIKVGSNHETEKEYGISHFIEHMLFEGTKTRTALDISREIEGLGGEIGAYTANERTCYYLKALTKHAERSADVMLDIITDPLFSDKIMEKERNVILSEINMRHDEPRYLQWDLLLSALFKDLPLGHPIIGNTKNIKGLKVEDLEAFFRKHYVASNMTLSVVGPRKVLDMMKNKFSSIPKGKPNRLRYRYPYLRKRKLRREKRKIKQSYSVFGYRTVPLMHKDAAALEMIRSILSKGMSGRIFDELRNKRGLAYDLGAHHNPAVNYGFFAFYVSTEPRNLSLCHRLIRKEIEKVSALTDKEFIEAKNFLEGEIIMEKEDKSDLADNLAFWDYAGDPRYKDNFLRALKKVGVKDIRDTARRYFGKDYARVIIGP
mgnify:CR=1 FL=1